MKRSNRAAAKRLRRSFGKLIEPLGADVVWRYNNGWTARPKQKGTWAESWRYVAYERIIDAREPRHEND